MEKEPIGNRIKNIRKKLGMNQTDFGNLIDDAHKSVVSKWEKGQNLPNNERLKKIAEIGNITVNELLYGTVEERAELVLLNEIKEKNELYYIIIDYLKLSTDLGEFSNGIIFDNEGKPLEPNRAMEAIEEVAEEEAKIFINRHLNKIIERTKIDTKSKGTFNGVDNEIIKSAINYIHELSIIQSNSIEGYYRSLINALEDIFPTSMGFADFDSVYDIYIKEGYSKEEANEKALETFYKARMADVHVNAMTDLKNLWREYKNRLNS